MLNYQQKPIIKWPGELRRTRIDSPFESAWGKTLVLLERELNHLSARNIILQVAVRFEDIRQDGRVYAHAKPEHPGVIVTFNSKHGPLSYWCDTYREWTDNVRAIALSLESLRRVDRYGVNKQGSQYAGYKQLNAAGETGNGRPKIETPEAAAEWIQKHVGDRIGEVPTALLLSSPVIFGAYEREGQKKFHPDKGGDDELFKQLQEAAAVLRKHHGL